MRILLILFVLCAFIACKSPTDQEASLSPMEEEQVFNMAKSYFLPLPEIDWESMSGKEKAKLVLGKSLFYDKNLSKNQTQNCASCHDMNRFGQDNLSVSPGDAGVRGVRNVPTVLNAYLQYAQLWDARAASVEEQSTKPIFGEVEMGMKDTLELMDRISLDTRYLSMFREAFPEADTLVSLGNIQLAIGSFLRTLVTPSRFDQYLKGDRTILSSTEKKGIKSFIDQGCIPCHSGVLLGGNMVQEFALFGYYWDYTNSSHLDKGVYQETLDKKDKFMFKVPSLRNVAETAPYFHDGSIQDLDEAIRIMSLAELNHNPEEEDVKNISAFFKSLTGEIPSHVYQDGTFPFE